MGELSSNKNIEYRRHMKWMTMKQAKIRLCQYIVFTGQLGI